MSLRIISRLSSSQIQDRRHAAPADHGAQWWPGMIPDLRFLIGAAVSIALLSIAALGIGATIHLMHQTKAGPLEASRLLAFNPNDRKRMEFGDPFAGLTTSPQGLRPSADMEIVQAPQAVPVPAEAEASSPADSDNVDERAVIDPPLPPDEDPILMATPADSGMDMRPPAETAVESVTTSTPPAQTGPAESASPTSADQAASVVPSSTSTSLEPSSATTDAVPTTAVEPAAPAPIEAAPTEAASIASAPSEAKPNQAPSLPGMPGQAAGTPAEPAARPSELVTPRGETAPVAATPSEAVSDPEPVGSVATTPAPPTAQQPATALPVAESQPKSHKAKAKAAIPKAKAKAHKAKAAAPKSKADPRRRTRTVRPNASTGYNVTTDGFFGAPWPRQTNQPKLLWPGG
jgi:hypothetical protein